MTYNIGDLTLEELDLLALAMDFFVCNGDIPGPLKDIVEELFMMLDVLSDEAHEETGQKRLLNKEDNLLTVDFSPKSI